MELNYFHCIEQMSRRDTGKGNRFTVAYVKPVFGPPTFNSMFLDKNALITINMGVSLCHYRDNFIKTEGRRLASLRVRPVDFQIDSGYPITMHKDSVVVNLVSVDYTWRLAIKIYKDTKQSRVVGFVNVGRR